MRILRSCTRKAIEKRWEQIHKMRAEGKTMKEITTHFGLARSSAWHILNRPVSWRRARYKNRVDPTELQWEIARPLLDHGASAPRINDELRERGCPIRVSGLRRLMASRPKRVVQQTRCYLPRTTMEMDFVELKLLEGERVVRVRALVVCDCHSLATFARVERRWTRDNVVKTIKEAWAYFGYRPTFLRCDNGPEFVRWVKHMAVVHDEIVGASPGIDVYPCNPGRPNEKSRVETANGLVKRWALLRPLHTIEDFNERLLVFLRGKRPVR